MKKPEIRIEDKEFRVLYIRYTGTYAGFRKESRSMFNELFAFAQENGLVNEGVTKVLTLYHDNPHITKEKNLKTSVAMTIPTDADIQESGRITEMSFSGRYAILNFDLKLNEYGEAWNYAYQEWLFVNDDVKARDAFPFELYVDEPPRNAKDSSAVEIYIPIES